MVEAAAADMAAAWAAAAQHGRAEQQACHVRVHFPSKGNGFAIVKVAVQSETKFDLVV
jgi:hypothetical protein